MERTRSDPDELPRIDEVVLLSSAAHYLHRSRPMIAKMIAGRQLDAWRIDGRLWVVSRASLEAALVRQRRREADRLRREEADGPTDDDR